MLNEAKACGLILNEEGEERLAEQDPEAPPEIHESLKGWWHLSEYIPRFEGDISSEVG
jgi:hypothetical protein